MIALAENWQSWAAGAVVLLTIAIFIFRLRRGRRGGCGTGCDCNRK